MTHSLRQNETLSPRNHRPEAKINSSPTSAVDAVILARQHPKTETTWPHGTIDKRFP
jgi:hypothetical protein